MSKEIQPLLFPQEGSPKYQTRLISGDPFQEKPKLITGSEAFHAEVPSIRSECLNKITHRISYGKGVDYWRGERERLISYSVAHMRLGPDEAEKAKIKMRNDLETQYFNAMDFIERYAETRGVEFYRQKVLHFKELHEAKYASNLGLAALFESESTSNDDERKDLEIQGFLLLQVADQIARTRHGILWRDPFPAFVSELQYERKADLARKRNKIEKGEAEKIKSQHRAKEDQKEFSAPYYLEKLTYWERIFESIVPNDVQKHSEYKKLHDEEIRKAGGTEGFSVRKEKPEYFEDILKSSDQLSPYSLYALGLQALRNPFKINRKRSEKIGFKLIIKAFEKAGIDSSRTFNFRGFQAFALYTEYLFKKSQTEPKGHAIRKEAIRQIGKSLAGLSGKEEVTHPEARINAGNNDPIPF